MANVFTSTASNSLGTSLVQGAYDKMVEFQNRHVPVFRSLADKRPVQVDKPGDSVTFQLYNDLTPSITALNETADPDIVGLPSTSSIVLSVNEYGRVVSRTTLLKVEAMSDVDPAIVENLRRDQVDTLDLLVRNELSNGTVTIAGNGTSGQLDGDTARRAHLKLVENAAAPRAGNYYACYLHPRVSFDLKVDTADAGYVDIHKYAAPDTFFTGTTGLFDGIFFVETTNAKVTTGATGAKDTYATLFAGAQALAEGVVIEPHTVINGVIVDALRRKMTIGWYGVLGWKIYRDKSLVRVEAKSSLDAVN